MAWPELRQQLERFRFAALMCLIFWSCAPKPVFKVLGDRTAIEEAIDAAQHGDEYAIELLFHTTLESDTHWFEAQEGLLKVGTLIPYIYFFWEPQHPNRNRILTLIEEIGPVCFVKSHKGKLKTPKISFFPKDPWYAFYDDTFRDLLVTIHTDEAKAALLEALQANYLPDTFRAQAAIGLGEYKDPKQIPILLKELVSPNQQLETRLIIAETLGRLNNREGLEVVLNALDVGDSLIQSNAIKALKFIPGDDVTEILEQKLQEQLSLSLKLDISEALAERGSSAGFDTAIAGLRYRVDGRRIYLFRSIDVLIKLGKKEALPYLQEVIRPSLLSKTPSCTQEEQVAVEKAIRILQEQ